MAPGYSTPTELMLCGRNFWLVPFTTSSPAPALVWPTSTLATPAVAARAGAAAGATSSAAPLTRTAAARAVGAVLSSIIRPSKARQQLSGLASFRRASGTARGQPEAQYDPGGRPD